MYNCTSVNFLSLLGEFMNWHDISSNIFVIRKEDVFALYLCGLTIFEKENLKNSPCIVIEKYDQSGLSHPFLGMGPGPLELGKIASL